MHVMLRMSVCVYLCVVYVLQYVYRMIWNCDCNGNSHEYASYIPKPGIRQLQIRQNHANETGSTGIAAFISDVWSTSDSSIFGRVSSGGSVGAMLCFLLFMLVRLLSTTSFFLQHIKRSHKRPQQPLHTRIFIDEAQTMKSQIEKFWIKNKKKKKWNFFINHSRDTGTRHKIAVWAPAQIYWQKKNQINETHFFGVSPLITLSWRLSVQAIGSLVFFRHGMQKQQVRTSSSGSVVVWILFILRQHRYLARHMEHLLRSFGKLLSIIVVAAFVATAVASVASVVAGCSIDVTSSMIFFCLFRLHHLRRFQQESVFVSVSFKIVATAAACFSSASNFCLPRLLQHDNFLRRRHGRHNADA